MTTARAKGTAFESAIRDYLRERGFDVERNGLGGSLDIGDLVVRLPRGQRVVVEAKNVVAMNLSGWVDESVVEAGNYEKPRAGTHAHPVVVHKRRGKGVHSAYATMPLSTLAALLGLVD